jgi:transcriptional regulator with XRE-family HTH domain
LRAALEESFYNVGVTSADMWQAVGDLLAQARHAKKWTATDVERAGGPSYKTVQAIETGQAGNVESLQKCAQALGLELVDILHAVLESKVTPLTPEAAHVVRAFTETTVAGRSAFVALANAVERVAVTPSSPSDAATPPAPHPPRPVPRAVTRRTVRSPK